MRNVLRPCLLLVALLSSYAGAGAAKATTAISKTPPTAALLDAKHLTPAQRELLISRAERTGWWLGFDDRLLIALPDADLSQALATEQLHAAVEARFTGASPASFSLQSRACDAPDDRSHLPAIVKVGRGNLVRTPPNFLGFAVRDGLKPIIINQQVTQRSATPARRAVNPALLPVLAQISPARWFADLSQLASWRRNSYSNELTLARDWLAGQFGGLGLTVQTPAFNLNAGRQINNVVATLTGTTLPDEWIVVGAHYDSRNTSVSDVNNASPGAEDNASGCAGVLELARILALLRPKRTIQFVCFAGEEQNLLGSEAYAASLQNTGQLGKVKLAVIMDMIGYSSSANSLDVLLETSTALAASLSPFEQAAADYVPQLQVSTSLAPFGSDHMPFINRGVPSLLLIQNEWDSYPHYHRTTDTPANVSNAQVQGPAVLRMELAVVATQAEIELPGFANGFE